MKEHYFKLKELIERNKSMEQETFEELYEQIFYGDKWDYLSLEKLISIARKKSYQDGMLKAKVEAIKAFKFVTDGYFIIDGTDYSRDRLNEFINELNS